LRYHDQTVRRLALGSVLVALSVGGCVVRNAGACMNDEACDEGEVCHFEDPEDTLGECVPADGSPGDDGSDDGDGDDGEDGGVTSTTGSGGTSTATGGGTSTATGGGTSTNPGQTSGTGTSSGGGTGNVILVTTLGTIVLDLDEDLSPITTENFLTYVESGFYDGADGGGATIFHRVVPGFVIQGGGLREDMSSKPTNPPIVNESENGFSNLRGTIAMARTADLDSATSQFYINVVDNTNLDGPGGYAVFGEVVEGMDVVDAIEAVPTTTVGPYEDVPVDPILIESATVD
jgi:cyclophilin family peptidyl-prolyl cis-trans isomerase